MNISDYNNELDLSAASSLIDVVDNQDFKKNGSVNDVVGYVNKKFTEASDGRRVTEDIWRAAYLAYRGEYDGEQQAAISRAQSRNPGASAAFVKVTKTKTQAAYQQTTDILLGEGRFPVSIEATPVPEGTPEEAYIDKKGDKGKASEAPKGSYGYAGDGVELAPGETSKSLFDKIAKKYQKLLKKDVTIVEGKNPDASGVTFNPAADAAKAMDKLIQDQLTEADGFWILSQAAFECVLYGGGVVKGPLTKVVTVDDYKQDPETKRVVYSPYRKVVPDIEVVSCWDFYPDPNARKLSLEEAEFVIQRHLLTKSQVRDLTNTPFFDEDAIKRVLKNRPSRAKEGWEDSIKDNTASPTDDRYEALEYWGILDCELAEAVGLDLESYDAEFVDVVQVNLWVCNGELLRAVLNPFIPKRIPYYYVPCERSPHQIWGVGVPENMGDTQRIMNGHIRMAIDNLRLSGSVMLEVDENVLAPNQDFSIAPGKIWRRNAGSGGQSIHSISINNTSQQHLMMFDKARQLADEATGMPSYAYGQTGVTGVGRTAAGISMLMGAASGTIKGIVSNFDEYLLKPLGRALFQWNMQFNDTDCDIRGDLKVLATGTRSLMQKEVLTQRLMSFIQIAGANPITAPLVNFEYVIKQVASSLGLDSEKIVNDPTTAKLYAEFMSIGKGNGNQQGVSPGLDQASASSGGVQSPFGGASAQDSSGGGGSQIGVGSAPVPGEDGFSSGT